MGSYQSIARSLLLSCSFVLVHTGQASAEPHEPTSEYVLMDFEDSVLHDEAWMRSAQPANTVMPMVSPKGDSGIDGLELAVGEGRGGGNALRVVANKLRKTSENPEGHNLPGFFVTMMQRGGSNIGSYRGYMIPRGVRANRLEMWVKFPKGFRQSSASRQPPEYPNHQNLHLGTYNFDPTANRWNERLVESSNWHFYHQIFIRHDKAEDGWIRIVLNEQPTHQRSISALPAHNPTSPAGDYFETMTRLYFDPVPYLTDPEVEYPVKMLVDDIKFSFVAEPKDITVDFPGYVRGHKVTIQTATVTSGRPEQAIATEFPVTIRNNTANEISGALSVSAFYGVNATLLDASTKKPVANPVTIKGNETRTFSVRASPSANMSGDNVVIGVSFVPKSEIQSDAQSKSRSFTNPLIERRWSSAVGSNDGFIYSDFIIARLTAAAPNANTPPDSEGGITCSVKAGETLSSRLVAQDPNNDPITFSVARQPEKGTLALNSKDGTFTFTPNKPLGFYDFFWYQVSDGKESSQARAVWIVEGTKTECDITPPQFTLAPPGNLRIVVK